jgi:hypothetical protein
VNELDLTNLPDHSLAFYLSADTTLDAGDFLMRTIPLTKAIKFFLKDKPVKITLNLPRNVDLTGQHILVMVDPLDKKGLDDVEETNETNNAASSPPIPALP